MRALATPWIRRCLGSALVLCAAWAACAQAATPADDDLVALGRRIYTEGQLAPGADVRGTRFDTMPVAGAKAACVTCHRPSGMGQVEGSIQIQPINGHYLFGRPGDKRLATMDPHIGKLFNQSHDPYTDASFATALRDGVNNRGKQMSKSMPRYAMTEAQLKAVMAYLGQLSSEWSPGVSQNQVRLATVITPDVDGPRRQVFIDMMRTIARSKSGSTVTANQSQRARHHMTSAAELILGTERSWDLEIWELTGPPESWGAQLEARYRSNPVFALVSGVSNTTWQPVHDFCAHMQVPCWFPSVALPGQSMSRYAFYFSAGVTLEAEVLANFMAERKPAPGRLVQVYRDEPVGRAAAASLTQALARTSVRVSERVMPPSVASEEALRKVLQGVEPTDTVMFWLRPADIDALARIEPVAEKRYFSSVLAGGDQIKLAPSWQGRSSLVYVYDLPEQRANNLNYFNSWLKLTKLPLVDEALQSEVFFAMNYLTDTLSEMLDNLYRDYLVERGEDMLGKRESAKAAQELRDRLALGQAGDLLRRHGPLTMHEAARVPIAPTDKKSAEPQGTTMYPHLSLAQNQRFASKGAYIVGFPKGGSLRRIAESELIIP